MDEKSMKDIEETLKEISKSLKSIANSLFWILHRNEVEP